MGDLLSGLEEFGFSNVNKLDVFKKEEAADNNAAKKAEHNVVSEADFLFDKSYVCPVCGETFKSKTVKIGKVKLLSADSDLRPKYQLVDSLKYDAVMCPACGYAALNRFFNYMTSIQAKAVKANISAKFKRPEETGDIYTYDDAIMRHKLALLNAIVTNAKFSEKAYTCLKLAWLCRGHYESLDTNAPNYKEEKQKLENLEKDYIQNAYEGFSNAIMKENFPMCGMDENTVTYLVAELARRCGKYEDSLRMVSRILVSREANERIKEKARAIKDRIKEATNASE